MEFHGTESVPRNSVESVPVRKSFWVYGIDTVYLLYNNLVILLCFAIYHFVGVSIRIHKMYLLSILMRLIFSLVCEFSVNALPLMSISNYHADFDGFSQNLCQIHGKIKESIAKYAVFTDQDFLIRNGTGTAEFRGIQCVAEWNGLNFVIFRFQSITVKIMVKY